MQADRRERSATVGLKMSNDDMESHVATLYDDGTPDEPDCDELFEQGMFALLGQIAGSGGEVSKPASEENVMTPVGASGQPIAPLPPAMQPSAFGNVNPPGTAQAPNAVTGGRNPLGISVDALSVSSSRQQNAGRQSNQAYTRRATPGTPGLPPLGSQRFPPHSSIVPPRSSTVPPPAPAVPSPTGSEPQNSNFKNSSGDKRKRAPQLVATYYVDVWVQKIENENTMLRKRMCRRCKEVVQMKSQSLLIHTANCRFTPLIAKKNALEQSRNRSIPKLSLDSRQGLQRELLDKAKEADRGREARDAVIAKRPLSQSSLEREAKRRKGPESSSRRTSSKDCEAKDCDRLNMAITKAIVWHNLPLSICDRQNSYDTPFVEMLDELKRDYPRCCKPNSDKFRNTYLPMYYDQLRERIQSNMNLALSSVFARGTIMFDGWEDVNGNAVVNVMLRVNATFLSGTATFFLDSVYTNDKKVDARKYLSIIEEVMRSFQGERQTSFTGVNGTVSDSARACVEAKRILAKEHAGVVGIQDQAHATDLLMADLGRLPWIEVVLSKVNVIVQATRNNRKLLSRFRELIAIYNLEIKKDNEKVKAAYNKANTAKGKKRATASVPKLQQPADDLWEDMDSVELDELDKALGSGRGDGDGTFDAEGALPTVRRTAVTLKKTVKTRFASAETMLEGYLRSREVLKRLILDPEFNRLYDGSRAANREKREKEFVEVIFDNSFYNQVEQVHQVLRVIRRYLRVWDAEKCQVSEVVPATILLEHSLRNIKETAFLTASKKQEILCALERRCKGPTVDEGASMHIRILQDVHYTSRLLDPNLCPVDVTEHLPALERHLNVYLSGAKSEISDRTRKQMAKAMVKKYKSVHQYWDTMKRGQKNKEVIESFGGYAARYWEDNTPAQSVSDCDNDPVAVDLEAFAVNTLSLCPSSCATERSFSHQGRIHTKQRNRLAPEVVRNLLFCKWNARVLRNLDRVQSFDQKRDFQKIKLGTLFPYEDFFNKPAFSSIFTDSEAISVLNRIHHKESRMQTEIETSRKELYQDSAVYVFATTRGESQIARAIPVPTLSYSAQASVHDRSTTLGEVSARPTSPTVQEDEDNFERTQEKNLASFYLRLRRLLRRSNITSIVHRKTCRHQMYIRQGTTFKVSSVMGVTYETRTT